MFDKSRWLLSLGEASSLAPSDPRAPQNAAASTSCVTTQIPCTMSLVHISNWSKVRRNCTKHHSVPRNNSSIATAGWKQNKFCRCISLTNTFRFPVNALGDAKPDRPAHPYDCEENTGDHTTTTAYVATYSAFSHQHDKRKRRVLFCEVTWRRRC